MREMHLKERGTGITTRQIQEAPNDAYFVWVGDFTAYPKSLANKLHRPDITIVGPSFFEDNKWQGLWFSAIILDHALRLNERQFYGYHRALANLRS